MGRTELRVLVLRGGPDRERPVSLQSGAQVSAALRAAGHTVREADAWPDDLSALDGLGSWGGEVVFPVLHGKWGEGGPLQRELEARGLVYVGSGPEAAARCMDKAATKAVLQDAGIDTPPWELLARGDRRRLAPPVVLKAVDEGSSFGMAICHDAASAEAAQRELHAEHPLLLAERYIAGREVTVGVVEAGGLSGASGEPGPARALPAIEVVPATAFYDYQAKYTRSDTAYRFDPALPGGALGRLTAAAERAHAVLGARHLSRVDFMVDDAGRAWALEVNTMPGFTTHSLLPMAAARVGWRLADLVDHLVRLAKASAEASRVA